MKYGAFPFRYVYPSLLLFLKRQKQMDSHQGYSLYTPSSYKSLHSQSYRDKYYNGDKVRNLRTIGKVKAEIFYKNNSNAANKNQ